MALLCNRFGNYKTGWLFYEKDVNFVKASNEVYFEKMLVEGGMAHLLHGLSHKISPPSEETPPLNISNPMCSALFLPPSCCLSVLLPHSRYSTEEAGRVRLGSSKAQLSSQDCHNGAPLHSDTSLPLA